jgi:hypothetical protein
MAARKTDIRKLPEKGGSGPNPALIEQLKREGKLKVYSTPEEMQRAREERKQRGVVETPVYLLPDDHFRKRKRCNVTLSKEARTIAKRIGGGVVSRGIERALLHWGDCPRTKKRGTK